MSNLKVIYETNDYFAVEKPAGILVYLPEGAAPETTLHDLVTGKLDFKKIGNRTGIVHRIDRETSGILLIAKNEKAEAALKKLFLHREIEKKYIALVEGKVEPEKGEISIPLGRSSKDRLRVVPKEKGKESRTLYSVINYFPKSNLSLLEVEIKTGRTHQIRVHFSSIGHPVVADGRYSRRKYQLERQFLHAKSLKFKDPFTGKEVVLQSELPVDLSGFLASLD